MKMQEGLMQMNELKELEIASAEQLKLASGGKHLMLKKPKRKLGMVIQLKRS
jgi:copper(I)-binding protein